MTTAIILSAGQGSRLLPLTADRPKCLIAVGGKAIIDHQLDALAEAGIAKAVVVGGYRIEKLAAHLAARGDGTELRINPFWALSSSIGSVWAARDVLDGDFVLLNGDTVYTPALIRDGLARAGEGISLFVEPINRAEGDDMLVSIADGLIRAVAKTLDPAYASHRSLGIVAARNDKGGYRSMLERVIAEPDGAQRFHHHIIHEIAQADPVHPVIVADGGWVEIDRPEDIAGWQG
jgi:choline kinase